MARTIDEHHTRRMSDDPTDTKPTVDNSEQTAAPTEPKTEGGAPTITLRVCDQSGEETFFRVKKSTKMEKVFNAYAQRKGVPAVSLRFLLDGSRINGTQTPEALDLEDQDQIDCLLEQTGGSF